jgi:GTP-binding protein
MLFKDEVEVYVKAGKGGDGAATFHREKFIEFGGPDGGDGGYGGHVFIKVNPHMRTLSHIHNAQKFRAGEGGNGTKDKMFGAKGETIYIEVPNGTVVMDYETKEVLVDLAEGVTEYKVAKGGRGGRGNVHFKSSTNQAPHYAEKGKPGEERHLLFELRMIAHVGLVGYPNAGKSTLVSRITNARPKIGDYPFTTLKPSIGVMTVDDAYTSVLIADIPGLIEGAHEGKGLGIEFLRHIERTRLILYVLDASDDPVAKFKVLRNELKSYSEVLSNRDHLVALNKMDLIQDEDERKKLIAKVRRAAGKVIPISALTGENLKEVKTELYRLYLEAEAKIRENEERKDAD